MGPESSRSEQVIEQYKKHKLLISGLRKIQAVILGYEKDREIDKSIASSYDYTIYSTVTGEDGRGS